MSPDEVKWVTLLSLLSLLLYVDLLGRFLITSLKDKPSNSLEGENQDVNP